MNEKDYDRRRFVKNLATLGSASLLAYAVADSTMPNFFTRAVAQAQGREYENELRQQVGDTKVVHSLCLGCNVRCGIRAHLSKGSGRIVRLEGNPYHPNNMAWKPITYETPVRESLSFVGRLCLKGKNFGIDHAYDPFRIRVPLKRAGPRGSMKWKAIPWEQLINEVVEGGKIFADVGEDRVVEGFRAVRDTTTSANPDMPDAGPKANQVVLFRGRGQPGRVEFLNARWLSGVLGSPNFIAHDNVCANGVQTAHKLVSYTDNAYVDQMRVDLQNAKLIIAFGDPYSAGQPAIVPAGAILSERIASGDLKLVVIDPRAGNAVVNANKWIPIKPGTDSALLIAMIRWIIENDRYNAHFLKNTTLAAAKLEGESIWTDATYLVVVDEAHPHYRKYLKAEDLGWGDKTGKNVVIVQHDGNPVPVAHDEVDHAELFYAGTVDGPEGKQVKVKTALQLLKEKAFERTMEEWATICGVDADDLKWLAEEFTGHGRYAGILVYRVFGAQPNGVYAVMAMINLHMLLGNINWKGGYLGGASFSWTKGIYDLESFPEKFSPKGYKISREGTAYENTAEFKRKKENGENPYPAKKPWFPHTYGGLWTEIFESIDAKYPYDCKIAITYFGNPIFVLPAGHKYVDTLKNKIPLHIAIDTTISETSMYADYIVPDVTGLEGSYGLMNPYPPNPAKWTGVRVPAIEPLIDKTLDGRPICAETFAIDVGKKLGHPGFGDKAIGERFPLNRAEDYFLRAIVNLAKSAEKHVKPATDDELTFVEENYPKSFVDYAKSILAEEEWRKVAYIIARGGVFESAETGLTPEGYHKYGRELNFKFWLEKLATTPHSITGKKFWGTAQYVPVEDMSGKSLEQLDEDYRYVLVQYKSGLHTQSRTIGYRWAREIYPENRVEIGEEDATKEGLRGGDSVKITSKSFPEGILGKIFVTKRVKPGTIAIMFHYGHWAHGSADVDISGVVQEGDPERGTGIWANRLMRIDDVTKAPVVDPISGAAPTTGIRVNLVKT